MKRVVFSILILLTGFVLHPIAQAHPGNTASDGYHYCWTNCAEWGEVYGERHRHADSGYVSVYVTEMQYVSNMKLSLKRLILGLGTKDFCSEGLVAIDAEIDSAFNHLSSYINLKSQLVKGFDYQCDDNLECAFMKNDLDNAMKEAGGYLGYLTGLTDKICETDYESLVANRFLQWMTEQSASDSTGVPSIAVNKIESSYSSQSLSSASTTSKAPILSSSEVMYERVCPRVVKRFSSDQKMWQRVNDRIQKRFGFVCKM